MDSHHHAAFKGRCPAIRRPGKKLVEPEVVATSPYRIKSPVPVCCGFSSRKVVLAAGFAPALATFSTSCLFCWTTRAKKIGASRRCCPGATFLQRKPAGCRKEAKWSQSPVLPWTQRAYETCLSAGSTAFGILEMEPPPGIAPGWPAYRAGASLKMLWGHEMVGARRLARPRLPDSESGGSAIPREPRAEKWRP